MRRPYTTAALPRRRSLYGPVTRARLLRTALLYGLLFASALALVLLSSSPSVQAFGLGLMAPGGGFLYFAAGGIGSVLLHVALTVASIGLFAAGVGLWWSTGNILAPPTVWLGSAGAAAAMGHHATWPPALWAVPAAIVLLAGGAWLYQRRRRERAIRDNQRRQAIIEHPERQRVVAQSVLTPASAAGLPHVEELPAEDLPAMRFLLDRGLQPVDGFEGFDMIEQFYFSAVRYALFSSSYSLSLTQYARMPAFRGYLSEAQRRLIEKVMLRTVWKYWRWENLWGNLRLGKDPVARPTRDDVMFTGWYSAMIAFYESNTGDDRYQKPGALTLRESPTEEFVYDLGTINRLLASNMEKYPFCLFPCEPGSVYVVCNNFAGIALLINDRLYGTDYWQKLEPRYREKLDEEFTTLDGRLVSARSGQTGLGFPGSGSTTMEALAAFYLHGLLPDVARRVWEIVHADLLHIERTKPAERVSGQAHAPAASIRVERGLADRYDSFNYKKTSAALLAMMAAAALEMGDREANQLLLELLEKEHPSIREGGIRHCPGVSVAGHAFYLMAKAGRQCGVLDLAQAGMPDAWRDGVLIEQAEYPNVLVAKAVSDGAKLDAVFHPPPGGEGARETIGLSQLRPGRRYRCRGAVESELVADHEGRAPLQLDLAGRTELEVSPLD